MLALPVLIVSLIILAISAYTDIKTLEVPDWVTFGGMIAGVGIHLVFAVQQWTWQPLISSALGLIVAFAIASLMFYTGQWGGGDAKLLMAMGALLGFTSDKFAFSTSFLINLVILGAAWGFLWTTGLAIIHAKRFWRTFNALRHHKPYARLRATSIVITSIFLVLSVFLATFRTEFIALAASIYLLSHLTIYIKSIELSCMHKWISPDKLTEGDWLVHTVNVGNTTVTPGKVGLEREDVAKLKTLHRQGKLGNVLVKYGVPFTPAFLIAFLLTLAYNNILLTILTHL